MATTAKQQSSQSAVVSSSRASSNSPSPQTIHHVSSAAASSEAAAAADDIEQIAKQISDHAEAIYQTWKARGLAPTEILNCHTVGGGETFGKALTPTPASHHHHHQQQQQQQQHHRRSKAQSAATGGSSGTSPCPSPSPSQPADPFAGFGSNHSPNHNSSLAGPSTISTAAATPDMSNNNNLEKLVNSFVHEDKARQQQAAARKTATTSILTSGTIRDALRKFESADRGGGVGGGASSAAPRLIRPNYVLRNATGGQRISGSGTATATAASAAAAAAATSATAAATLQPHLPKTSSPVATTPTLAVTATSNAIAATAALAAAAASASATTASAATTTATTTTTTKLNKHVPDVLMNTIEQSATAAASSKESSPPPFASSSRQKPETPAKPASLINHQPAWPLVKGRGASGNSSSTSSSPLTPSSSPSSGVVTAATSPVATSPSVGGVGVAASKKSSSIGAAANGHNVSPSANGAPSVGLSGGGKSAKAKTSSAQRSKAAADLLDEVLLEEERLINALKTGTVLSGTVGHGKAGLPEVITSTMQPDCERVWPPQESSVLTATAAASMNGKSGAAATPGTMRRDEPDNATANTAVAIVNGVKKSALSGSAGASVHDMPASALAAMKITKSPRPRNDAAVPHPEISLTAAKLSGAGSQAKGGGSTSTVRPFLARGSVAERVLMFEKCPDHQPPRREPSKIAVKPTPPAPEQHTTLQRRIRSSKNVYIPKFYYPHGKPTLSVTSDQTLQRILSAFDGFPDRQTSRTQFDEIVEACGYPRYWRMPLFSCAQVAAGGPADGKRFVEFWKEMNVYCHDDTSRFIYIMARGDRTRPYIQADDLITLVQDVVDTHPGLAFLKEASEFHSRYVHTVIARIFYTVNRSWTGRITVPELRRSNLLQVLQLLEEEEDINQIMAFFSYEHFYVIYCKFWELDRDHDLYIDQNDLARHNDHALSTRIIERIFSGCVTKGAKSRQGVQVGKMSYTEFVWFLLSEEDKTHPTAVEYWFRCMDLDGDGVLSMYELEYFYEEQQHRMESIGIETLPFEDCLCQMLDMVKPQRSGFVTLGDLKRCKTTPIFFDTFFNLEKYMEHEQRDPFATQRDQDEMTDWDRFAAQEYELLVAEEGGDTQGSYDEEDEYESNIDILESQLDDCMSTMVNEW